MKGRWTCQQHGDSCSSYVNAGREYNEQGITPETVKSLPKDEQDYIVKCLRWVEE